MKISSPQWLITDASRGIDAAIAQRAVSDGAMVSLLARSEDVERTAPQLGPRAKAVRMDVRDTNAGLSERVRAQLIERIPLDRPAEPAEIADAVPCIAGAIYVAGVIIPADGGLLAALGSMK